MIDRQHVQSLLARLLHGEPHAAHLWICERDPRYRHVVGHVDDVLAQGRKSGYSFVWTGDGAVPSVTFIVTAAPQVVGGSGQLMYCTDHTGVIYYDSSGSGCTNASLVLQ